MLKTRVRRTVCEMWHGMHLRFLYESQSLCKSRTDYIGVTGAKLITGSSENPYMDKISALATWQIEPGWDSVIVVRDFIIVRAHTGQRTSSIAVRYTALGQLSGTSVTPARQHEELVTFDLIMSGNEWKIERPLIPPHVSVQAEAAALRDLLSDEKDPQRRKRLDQGLAVLSRWSSGHV
jgi:hypothetical protein